MRALNVILRSVLLNCLKLVLCVFNISLYTNSNTYPEIPAICKDALLCGKYYFYLVKWIPRCLFQVGADLALKPLFE